MPNALSGHDLLPASPLLRLTDVQHRGPDWIVMADGPLQAACPTCGRVSTSRHSAYVRTGERSTSRWCDRLAAHSRQLGGDASPRRVPSGSLPTASPGVGEVRGRRTCRADVVARLIGYALGGRAGERLT